MSNHKIGDGPIDTEYVDAMNDLAHSIDQVFNGDAKRGDRKVGFVVMVFPFGEGEGRCSYISNANRDDIVCLLKEQLARFEGRMIEPGKGNH